MNRFYGRATRAVRMRPWTLRMLTAWPLRAFFARTFQKADAITLKDYARDALAIPESSLLAASR